MNWNERRDRPVPLPPLWFDAWNVLHPIEKVRMQIRPFYPACFMMILSLPVLPPFFLLATVKCRVGIHERSL